MSVAGPEAWTSLVEAITTCRRCPRLVAHREQVAASKRRAFRDCPYWGRPVPGFGDPAARVVVIGLAPAAHGANRTGRMFTGDASGDWLVRALYKAGFANQPASRHRDDGLLLSDLFVTAACRCAPPGNRPTAAELAACRTFLARELDLLPRLQVVIALGRIAFDTYLRLMRERGHPWPSGPESTRSGLTGPAGRRRKPVFRHGAVYRWPSDLPVLIASYHPSRQNTQTGVLTKPMFQEIFLLARRLVDDSSLPPP